MAVQPLLQTRAAALRGQYPGVFIQSDPSMSRGAEFQHELEHNVSNQSYILDLKNLAKPECLTGGDRLLDLVEKFLEYWTCQEAPDIRS